MSRRTTMLTLCVIISALPLIWLSLDPRAGEKLNSLTKTPSSIRR